MAKLEAADLAITMYISCLAGHSDDERGHFRGGDVGRSDSGEVEMTEFDRPGMARNSSASMLEEQAGTRAGTSRSDLSVIIQSLLYSSYVPVYSPCEHVVGTKLGAFLFTSSTCSAANRMSKQAVL